MSVKQSWAGMFSAGRAGRDFLVNLNRYAERQKSAEKRSARSVTLKRSGLIAFYDRCACGSMSAESCQMLLFAF